MERVVLCTNWESLMVRSTSELLVGMAAGLMSHFAHGGGWGLEYAMKPSVHPRTELEQMWSTQEKHRDGGVELVEAILRWARYLPPTIDLEYTQQFKNVVDRRLKAGGKGPYFNGG